MLDISTYYAKLAANEVLTENEVVALLKELAHFRSGIAHLASCQAATLEGLPKAISKARRGRHVELCKTAAALLAGDASRVRHPTDLAVARTRCLQAVDSQQDAGTGAADHG